MFFKKSVALIVTFALIFCVAFAGVQVVFAEERVLDAQDQYFLEFVREDTDIQQIEFESIDLYNQNLTVIGRQYVFTVDNVSGYALTTKVVIDQEYFYEVEELFYNLSAPFQNCQGYPVYLTFKTYLDCVDGVFYDLANDRAVVSNQAVEQLAFQGFGYLDTGDSDYIHSTETINYSTKNTQTYTFPYGAPNLMSVGQGSCCVNVAGGIIICYYDKFFENLIPNYQPYTLFCGVPIYRDCTAESTNVILTLRDYMAVEGVTQGTTFAGFQQGMTRYVQEHGYTYSTDSVMSWGNFNFSSYQQAVENEIPVALFLNNYTMIGGVEEQTNKDIVYDYYRESTHVEVGIGYRVDTYYNASGSAITTRRYLHVVSGLSTFQTGYLNINGNGQIVNAIAIDIY